MSIDKSAMYRRLFELIEDSKKMPRSFTFAVGASTGFQGGIDLIKSLKMGLEVVISEQGASEQTDEFMAMFDSMIEDLEAVRDELLNVLHESMVVSAATKRAYNNGISRMDEISQIMNAEYAVEAATTPEAD